MTVVALSAEESFSYFVSNPEISHENKYKLLSTAEPDKVKTESNRTK